MLFFPRREAGFSHALGLRASPEEPSLPAGHIPALDALRGLAIVVVTLYRFGGGTAGPGRALEPGALVELGSRGVDLFFVLSGFLITGILFDAKGRAHYFRNFYVRRALRIFPLYYAVLALALVILPRLAPQLAEPFAPALARQGWLWLYGANLVQSLEGAWCLGPLDHFRSLAIEEHFYLVWPAVIFACSRLTALRLSAALAVGSVLGRGLWLAAGGNPVAAEVCTLFRMEGLLLGSWLALAARGPGGLGWLLPRAKLALLALAPAALLVDLVNRRFLGLADALWAAAFAAGLVLVVAAPAGTVLGRWGQSPLLRFFGRYSYAMYAFQLPLVYLLAPLATAPGLAQCWGSPVVGQVTYCALMCLATTFTAVVSWHGFEKHVLAWKSRFA